MDRHPRRTAALEIPPELQQRLASIRARWNVTAAPELDVDRVRAIEATAGVRVPEPILAMFAASIPQLEQRLGMTLSRLPEHSARARECGARGDFVAFAAMPDGRSLVGFVKGDPIDQLRLFDMERRGLEPCSLHAWLDALAFAPADADGPAFRPRLVRQALPVEEGKRVRHKAWGMGTVLAESGEGPTRKVKVSFPDHGLKVVQARFLEDATDS